MNPTFAVLAATLVAFSYAGLINIGYEQRVTVRGKLVCPSDPSQAVGVKVKLVDKDMGTIDSFRYTLYVLL